MYEFREKGVPAKQKYMAKDMQDWARYYGLKIKNPPSVFPVNSVKALRGALVALEQPDRFLPYSYRVFETYWGEDKDISQDAVLRAIVEEVGLDPQEYFEKIARQEYKDRVRANTDEVMQRGGYGTSDHVRQRLHVFWQRPAGPGRRRAETQYLGRFPTGCSRSDERSVIRQVWAVGLRLRLTRPTRLRIMVNCSR